MDTLKKERKIKGCLTLKPLPTSYIFRYLKVSGAHLFFSEKSNEEVDYRASVVL